MRLQMLLGAHTQTVTHVAYDTVHLVLAGLESAVAGVGSGETLVSESLLCKFRVIQTKRA